MAEEPGIMRATTREEFRPGPEVVGTWVTLGCACGAVYRKIYAPADYVRTVNRTRGKPRVALLRPKIRAALREVERLERRRR